MSIHPAMGSSADRWRLLRRIDDLKAENERLRAAHAELALYFTSRNGVPVERTTIKTEDFVRITGLTPNAGIKPPAREAGRSA